MRKYVDTVAPTKKKRFGVWPVLDSSVLYTSFDAIDPKSSYDLLHGNKKWK
jgi:hypothetical protein